MKQVLAFDFGASSGRAMLSRYDGGKLTVTEIHRFSNDPVSVGGTMYWDILRLWYEIKQAFYKLRQSGEQIDAVGIDTWGVDFGLIGRNGKLLANPVHYRDSRTHGMPEEVFGILPQHEIYRRTGIQTMHFNTLYQLYYLAKYEPELLAETDKILMIPDLFAYFLTGKMRVERTNASTTNFLNPETREWDIDLLDTLGIPTRILPDLIEAGETYGTLTPDLAAEFGLAEVPVIAVCTHDTGSAVAAAPAEGDFAYISCGTWSLFGVETDKPDLSPEAAAAGFSNEGTIQGGFRPLKNIVGMWIIQECRRDWIKQGKKLSWDEIVVEARQAAPFRSIIDTDSPEFYAGGNMEKKIREFCVRTGQPVPETVGEVARCIYESLALKYRHALEGLEKMKGARIDSLNIVGGGIQNRLLNQMVADALDRPVVTGPIEGAAMGNLLTQAMALGDIGSLDELREVVRRSEAVETWEPHHTQAWEDAYGKLLTFLK